MSRHVITILLALAGALGASGCAATFTPAEPAVTYYGDVSLDYAAAVPPDIWAYPRVYYDGAWAYLVNGAWYVPTRQGWMFYRREPVELRRQRTRIYASPSTISPPPRGTYSPAYPAYPREVRPPVRTEPYEYGRERTPR
jgi:hypothetical protein